MDFGRVRGRQMNAPIRHHGLDREKAREALELLRASVAGLDDADGIMGHIQAIEEDLREVPGSMDLAGPTVKHTIWDPWQRDRNPL